jgi:hypothetical protein
LKVIPFRELRSRARGSSLGGNGKEEEVIDVTAGGGELRGKGSLSESQAREDYSGERKRHNYEVRQP